mmetsp:Transcript_19406/g.28979  ORF Transcript_19406/g.28979 Transcript_19406/m.28979 type:complete len:301 (+) Transcript_19406:1-903(+)
MAASPFFLPPPSASGNKTTYSVHPLVVFNILDHYRRRELKQHRVVGTLLGSIVKTAKGRCINVKNSFPIPHTESEDEVSIDFEYHSKMTALQKRLHPNETVVGWYSTGKEITYTSSLIHFDIFSARVSRNVMHLVVDATLASNRLSVKGYLGRPIRVGDKYVVAQFEQIETNFESTEPAKIAVDAMINGVPDSGEESKKLDAPATMLSELENLEHSLQELLHLLSRVSDFVNKVVEGDKKGTIALGSKIKDALACIPRVDPDDFTRIFNQKTEDLLMLLYLSNITRAQVALGNRIYEVLD